MRRAKIVCTMGPAALAPGVLEDLVRAGMDCARLNFSHGEHSTHLQTAERVRAAGRAAGRHVSVLADLQGPKIRVGTFADGPIELLVGSEFVLTGRDVPSSRARASVSYPLLARELSAGDLVLLDDGLLGLRVLHIDGDDVVCLVETGGTLSDRKGVNLPGAKLSVPALTPKDRVDLRFAIDTVHADYLALSFVRQAADLREARLLAGGTPLIAKIEKPEALENLLEIIDESDGVMVARGDLGVEVGSAQVPMQQKRIIAAANARGKLVITATQMLDSMIRNPRPTRAEAADVANAILDGSDAVMLSGETAMGRYPRATVEMMAAITLEAENNRGPGSAAVLVGLGADLDGLSGLGEAVRRLCLDLPLAAVVVTTRTGLSAELVAAHRPSAPLYAMSESEAVLGRLALRWGVQPRLSAPAVDLQGTVAAASQLMRDEGHALGSRFALVTAWLPAQPGNLLLLLTLQ